MFNFLSKSVHKLTMSLNKNLAVRTIKYCNLLKLRKGISLFVVLSNFSSNWCSMILYGDPQIFLLLFACVLIQWPKSFCGGNEEKKISPMKRKLPEEPPKDGSEEDSSSPTKKNKIDPDDQKVASDQDFSQNEESSFKMSVLLEVLGLEELEVSEIVKDELEYSPSDKSERGSINSEDSQDSSFSN